MVRWSGGQVVRWSGCQVVRVVRVVSLDDMHQIIEKSGDVTPADTRTVESRAVFCSSRIHKNINIYICMIIVLVDIIWFRGLSLPFHTVGDICMKAKHLISHQKWKNISKKIDRFRFLAKKGKHCIPSPSPTPPGRAFRGLP